MAALTTKLNLKKNSTTENVTSYSVQGEGTVKTASGGTYWQINNNGTTAYIGLWPTSVTSGGNPNHSMLKIKKSNTEYWVEKTVNNNYTLTLAATSNQTITLKYTQPGASQVTKTSTGSAQNFTVEVGTTWTATIAGASGYNPGTLSPGSSGTVNGNVTVSASAATAATLTITVQAIGAISNGVYFKYTNTSGSTVAASTQNGTILSDLSGWSISVTIKYNTPIRFFWGESYNSNSENPVEACTTTLYVNGSSKGNVTLPCYNLDNAATYAYNSGNLTANATFKFVYVKPSNPGTGPSNGEGSWGETGGGF